MASNIRNVLMQPDSTDPYGNIKKESIARAGESSQQEIRQLFPGEELGNRKTSDLLRSMKSHGILKSSGKFNIRIVFVAVTKF